MSLSDMIKPSALYVQCPVSAKLVTRVPSRAKSTNVAEGGSVVFGYHTVSNRNENAGQLDSIAPMSHDAPTLRGWPRRSKLPATIAQAAGSPPSIAGLSGSALSCSCNLRGEPRPGQPRIGVRLIGRQSEPARAPAFLDVAAQPRERAVTHEAVRPDAPAIGGDDRVSDGGLHGAARGQLRDAAADGRRIGGQRGMQELERCVLAGNRG